MSEQTDAYQAWTSLVRKALATYTDKNPEWEDVSLWRMLDLRAELNRTRRDDLMDEVRILDSEIMECELEQEAIRPRIAEWLKD